MSIDRNENIFYVYAYLDPRKPGSYEYGEFKFNFEPFYIGKGYGSRLQHHAQECHLKNDGNRLKTNKIRKLTRLGFDLKNYIFKIKPNLTNAEACCLEISCIKTIGRSFDKSGPLTNLTLGGEGSLGHIHAPEILKRISESKKGKPTWNKGKTGIYSQETLIKMGASKRGKKHTIETKNKMSQGHMGQIPWNRGIPATDEARRKLMGHKPWNKGIPRTDDEKLKMSIGKMKLSAEQIKTIYQQHHALKISRKDLAKSFGISIGTIRNIVIDDSYLNKIERYGEF